MKIPNEITKNFTEVEGRREIIEKYADSEQAFFGINEDEEQVELHVAKSGIILKTYQKNGWVRVNYYDSEGYSEGESFEGKWNK